MNIVKLVISFCDHCVLLCNKCAKCLGFFSPSSASWSSLPGCIRFGCGLVSSWQERAHWFRQTGPAAWQTGHVNISFVFSWSIETSNDCFRHKLFPELALDKSTLNVSLCLVDYIDRIERPSWTHGPLAVNLISLCGCCCWEHHFNLSKCDKAFMAKSVEYRSLTQETGPYFFGTYYTVQVLFVQQVHLFCVPVESSAMFDCV